MAPASASMPTQPPNWRVKLLLLAFGTLVALLAAAIYTWLPAFVPDAKRVMLNLQEKAYPLIGAVLGYNLRR